MYIYVYVMYCNVSFCQIFKLAMLARCVRNLLVLLKAKKLHRFNYAQRNIRKIEYTPPWKILRIHLNPFLLPLKTAAVLTLPLCQSWMEPSSAIADRLSQKQNQIYSNIIKFFVQWLRLWPSWAVRKWSSNEGPRQGTRRRASLQVIRYKPHRRTNHKHTSHGCAVHPSRRILCHVRLQ